MTPDNTAKAHWIHVVVQDPGTPDEVLMGFETDQISEPFIPAFERREEAEACFLIMPRDVIHHKYEVHAMLRDDLLKQAQEKGFKVFVMDDKSRIRHELGKA